MTCANCGRDRKEGEVCPYCGSKEIVTDVDESKRPVNERLYD